MTTDDYAEIIRDTLDEAVGKFEHGEIERLCKAVREKVSAILQENRRGRPDDKPASETDRDPGDRWWDR